VVERSLKVVNLSWAGGHAQFVLACMQLAIVFKFVGGGVTSVFFGSKWLSNPSQEQENVPVGSSTLSVFPAGSNRSVKGSWKP
jgi:hypothetical protein